MNYRCSKKQNFDKSKLDSMLSDETKQKLEEDNLAEAEAAKF